MSNFLGQTSLLATTIWQFINFFHWPSNHAAKTSHFYEDWGFPGVVGAVDGTHVHIIDKWGDIPIEKDFKASVLICYNFAQCKAFFKAAVRKFCL